MSLSFERRAAGFPPSAMSNVELWRWRVDQTPDRRWLWYAGHAWSFAEFDLEVRRLAAGLQALGVAPGMSVLVGMTNCPEAVQVHLALLELGAVGVPLVPGMPFSELAHPIGHSEAQLMIANDPIASLVLDHRRECPAIDCLVLVGDLDASSGDGLVSFADLLTVPPIEHRPLPSQDDQSLSLIIYTSGSTGKPKGVMLKAGSFYASGLGYSDRYGLHGEDTYFLSTSLAHSLGAAAGLGIGIVTGGGVALAERFRPSMFWQQVHDSGATVAILFATHLNLLLATDDGQPGAGDSSLRLVVSHADHPRFRSRFGVDMGTVWGMTETLVCAGSDPGYAGELGPGYIGYPWPGAEVAIFDESFQRVGPGVYGELCLRHPQAMIGYLKDPEATAATLIDGWVRSGDRAISDHSGRVYFAGRYKSMIKRSGENVSAEEVEGALVEDPLVAECVVFGVPDELRSEEVAVVVVRQSGVELEPDALWDSCATRLVRWKLPRYIIVVDEPLPRLPTGKFDRVRIAGSVDLKRAWDAERDRAARA